MRVVLYVFACISKKNNTEPIKQETNGNYLWGSEKKERQEQDRRKKVEKQVEMYTFIFTCFLIFILKIFKPTGKFKNRTMNNNRPST